ncbi:succinylglutamate desuccinylase/aspartoacylase family protein [Halogeometricum luteum]|uniref:Succinylglutamate desuccinylase/aspartoacylase family protein n=1 Tax=Halogeometricum luteum TaxID=2950537 RepID=A0ABU2FY35_9EURY|nr:succinylglutamate desuccinylase/aspartoacylase family protein [Halogeometricum sp. S3BR5-2]MDS0293442.1 succinylglutamate desuccinylase/aspartoacylase family protein [Halogeometricum sp. S3BR5-2]
MSSDRPPEPFRYDAEVRPGEKRHVLYEVGESYLGDAIELPVTVINGSRAGPRAFVSAAMHGDEVNGVKVVQEVADRYDPQDLAGTIVCLHVVNVPGYRAHMRYLPIYDRDLNRSFPGSDRGNEAQRIAKVIYDRFVSNCEFGVDFHTSTRNKVTIFHTRADMSDPAVAEVANGFLSAVVLDGVGSKGMLRRVASEDGIPTITVEMGEAKRYQPLMVERALEHLHNLFASFGMVDDEFESEPPWQRVVGPKEKTWIRSNAGGWVDMEWGPYPIIDEGDAVCTISDHFKREEHVVEAPFTGLVVGMAANPITVPGQIVAHLVAVDEDDRPVIEDVIDREGYAALGTYHWMGRQTAPGATRRTTTRKTDATAAGERNE